MIEREVLHKQCAEVSCKVDDLTKLSRRLATITLRASERGENVSAIFGFNALLIACLGKTIAKFSLILELLLAVAGDEVTNEATRSPETLVGNLLTLQPQAHQES